MVPLFVVPEGNLLLSMRLPVPRHQQQIPLNPTKYIAKPRIIPTEKPQHTTKSPPPNTRFLTLCCDCLPPPPPSHPANRETLARSLQLTPLLSTNARPNAPIVPRGTLPKPKLFHVEQSKPTPNLISKNTPPLACLSPGLLVLSVSPILSVFSASPAFHILYCPVSSSFKFSSHFRRSSAFTSAPVSVVICRDRPSTFIAT